MVVNVMLCVVRNLYAEAKVWQIVLVGLAVGDAMSIACSHYCQWQLFPAYNSISFKRDNVTFEEKAASRKVDKKSTIVGKGFANGADAFVVAYANR